MTALIVFLMIIFFAPAVHAEVIQPPIAEQWRHAKTCEQVVDVATQQATYDMADIGVPLTSSQIRPIIKAKLKSLPNSPCYQPKHASKSDGRSQN